MKPAQSKLLSDYARLIAHVGVNVQPKQIVLIDSIIEAAPLTEKVVEECYNMGASKVVVKWHNAIVNKLNFKYQTIDTLTDFKKYELNAIKKPILKHGACRIRIGGDSPEALKDIDPNKIKAYSSTLSALLKKVSNWTMANKCQWTIAYYPSLEWSKLVFPKLSPTAAQKKLLDLILKTVRVDGINDPVVLWKKHNQEKAIIAKKLNDLKLDYLIFKNSLGTNIKVKLVKHNIWESGQAHNANKTFGFTPNLPTEEVWGMPDKDGLDGIVYASMPLSYNGNIVDKFYFEFSKGKVVKYDAQKGKEVLDNIFQIHNADHTGEIALVSKDSAVFATKTLFYSTLFDENAACHIALGASYPSNIKNGTNLSRKELFKKGANDSIVHIDFMFGTDDIEVIGYKDEKAISIMKDCTFLI
ncbi:MAG: aminopeptidase [Mycoplasmataceae bacterium]|nr:aminopeptidase [Mycoplasmataceae bacterium]